MVRINDIPEAEVHQVLRDAMEMYDRERTFREGEARRRELEDAARELGIPAEYLERAAAGWRERRLARKRRSRWMKGGGIFALGAGAGIAAFALLAPRPVPPPAVAAPAPVVVMEPDWRLLPWYGEYIYQDGNLRWHVRGPRWIPR